MTRFEAVTCLGCGCTCDDIIVTVDGGRISQTERACPLGQRWFGDGSLSLSVRVGGKVVEVGTAIAEVAGRLGRARGRAMVYLAADASIDDQRAAVALADAAGCRLDNVSSDTVASGVLASQRRGRSSATLGEVRERADLVMYWGVDPAERYPRFTERYLPRAGRRVIAVDIGAAKGPPDADQRLTLSADQELVALSLIRAAIGGRPVSELPAALNDAAEIGRQLLGAKYVVVVVDAEPSATPSDPGRSEGLAALTLGLNTPTRAALCTLRGGGNRQGAEQVMTWQTGFPMTVSFASGAPGYQPDRPTSALLEAGALDLVIVAGDLRTVPTPVLSRLTADRVVVIGPGAAGAAPAEAIAIDTGRAGIHYGGTGFRLDEIPLPLTALLPNTTTVAGMLKAIQAGLAKAGSR